MKKSKKSLMLLPLLAICLSGCYTIIPEDAPEEIEDEFTPEGSYTLPEEDSDYTESSSIPYESTEGDTESTGGDSSSSPSETPGEGGSSDSGKPSEPSDPTNPSESDSSSSSTPSETHEYSYFLKITNKDDLASLTLDENNSSSNIYTLSISLISYDYDIQLSSEAATEDDVIVTSSNEAAVIVDGLTLIPQVGGGETTISATWKLHNEATDSFAVTVDYIPYTPEESYEYKLVIENKEELGSTWKITDTKQNVSHTLEVKLYEYKYLDGDLADDYPIINNASLSDVDISFTDDSVLGISTDSISLYPTGVGSTDVTLTWIEHPEAYDSFSVIVEEVTYEYDYTLAITNSSDFDADEDNVWRVGDSYKTLSVSLTSTTYTGSSDTSEPNTIDGDSSNVSVSFTPEEGSPENGLTVWGLNLMANAAGTYIVTATWIDHEEATDSITVTINEKMSTSYTMSVSDDDKSNMEEAWYVEDEESRSFNIDIVADDGEAVDLPYKDSDIIVLHSPSELEIDSSVNNGQITITPIGITSDVTITLFVYWSRHSEAHITLTLSLNQHSYTISITNDTELASSWSVEDGYREVQVEAKKDGTTYDQDPYIKLIPGSDDSDSITIDGLKITPNNEGKPTVTAVWYKYDPNDVTYADSNVVYAVSNTVQLSIDENIEAKYLTLSTYEISLSNAFMDTETITATAYGQDNETLATDQSFTWSTESTGIVITGEGSTVTIGVTGYNISGTVKCTTANGEASQECSVYIGAQPSPTPSSGDQTYVLGTVDGNGEYRFFNGESSNSSLGTTAYWDEAAEVYITLNPYDGIDGSFVLSFYDKNNELKYIYHNGSNTNVTTSSDDTSWTYEDTYGAFVEPDSNRFLGLHDGTTIGAYGHTNITSSDYSIISPYSDKPSDYEEPKSGHTEGTYVLGCLYEGTYYYFSGSTTGSTFLGTTTSYMDAAEVYINPVAGVENGCTLSFINSSGATKYITGSSSGTSITLADSTYTWYWLEDDDVFANGTTSSDRAILYYSSSSSFRGYQMTGSNLNYAHVHAYSVDPADGIPQSVHVLGENEVTEDEYVQLSTKIYPDGITDTITWTSSNDSYATVDSNGLVHGIKPNEEVVITATLDSHPDIFGTITIAINEAEAVEYPDVTLTDDNATDDFSSSSLEYSNSDDVELITRELCTISFEKGKGSNTPKYYTSGTNIRVYDGNIITFSPINPNVAIISSIVLTVDSSYHGGTLTITNGSSSLSNSNKTLTITPEYLSGHDITLQNGTGSGGSQLRITSWTIYYIAA